MTARVTLYDGDRFIHTKDRSARVLSGYDRDARRSGYQRVGVHRDSRKRWVAVHYHFVGPRPVRVPLSYSVTLRFEKDGEN